MTKNLAIIFLLSLNTISFSQVEMASFYFLGRDTELTEYSSGKLDALLQRTREKHLQVIELNVFSNVSNSYDRNKVIGEKRIQYILKRLNANESNEMTINNFGSERIPVSFSPVNWNRVDIYFGILNKRDSLVLPDRPIIIEVPPQPDTNDIVVEEPEIIPEEEKIVKNTPIPLPIQFVGGKTDIKEESMQYVDHLYNTLKENPELTAHIRGHVCCRRNKGKSKKRAKNVYKLLVKRGINRKRLTFAGYSNTIPIVFPERTEADRKMNRRVDIIFNDH